MRGALAVLLVAFAVCGAAVRDAAPATGGPAGLSKRCAAGSVAAVISGRHVCLRAGQRCAPRLDPEYQRFGFRCPPGGRLERVPPPAGTVIATIADSPAGDIAAGEGAIWVRSDNQAQVVRVSPRWNAIVDRIDMPTKRMFPATRAPSGIAVGDGGVWVSLANDDVVVRIDRWTDSIVATIPVGDSPAGIATTPGAVWVANDLGESVSRIDPFTNRVVATIPVFTAGELAGPISIAAGAGAVWVVVPHLHGVVRINPATNAIDAVIPIAVGSGGYTVPANGIAADASAGVWVAGLDLTRIDPDSNRVVAAISGVASPSSVAIGFGSVWVTSWAGALGFLQRVDPSTNTIVGESRPSPTPSAVAVGFGSVWVQDTLMRNVLLRIRPANRRSAGAVCALRLPRTGTKTTARPGHLRGAAGSVEEPLGVLPTDLVNAADWR